MAAWSSLSVSVPTPSARTKLVLQRAGQVASLFRVVLMLKLLLGLYRHVYAYGIVGSSQQVYRAIKNAVLRLLLKLPSAKAEVKKELGKTEDDLSKSLAPTSFSDGIVLHDNSKLPEKGRDIEWLRAEWANLHKLEKDDVTAGRVSGAVYHGGEELNTVIQEAMSNFLVTNPLHPDVFPGVRKMESELVRSVLNLFSGPNGAGTTTCGGTESILMSVKTHRDWARAVKGIKEPEMVIPSTAHAAFHKASQYFNIKLHIIPSDPKTRKVDPKLVKRFINPNTIMIVGSAPNFPDGMVDPIPELGKLAQRYNVGLHVDCCLGSFIIAFAGRAGYGADIPKFDFSVPGVTAISCDTHKYAFAPKGSSIIMYRSKELRRYQYYVFPDWSGGLYASPSMAGSRPGAIIAGAWAVINHIGVDGYTESAKTIIGAARHFAEQIRTQPRFSDISVIGDPKLSVVAVGSRDPSLNIYGVADRMSKKGWHLNAIAEPPGVHMAFTRLSAAAVEQLLDDLAVTVKEEKESPLTGGNMVALYGVGQTSVGPMMVTEVGKIFLDCLYK